MHWLDDLSTLGFEQPCILITVVGTQGSCPRNLATRMLVTHDQCSGTIGGGHLEYKAIDVAMNMLKSKESRVNIKRFVLGASLGQCCGGAVHLSFEPIPAAKPDWITRLIEVHRQAQCAVLVTQLPQHQFSSAQQGLPIGDVSEYGRKLIVDSADVRFGSLSNSEVDTLAIAHARYLLSSKADTEAHWHQGLLFDTMAKNSFHVAVFGAGHVGKALVKVLSTLSCQVSWIDSRADEFPDACAANVNVICSEYPEDEIDTLPCQSHIIVMTHSHAMDQKICERALRRDDVAFCGLIGSMSKRQQFRKRLLSRGVSTEQWDKLTCPIGVGGISGKQPARIAIAVSAQLLQIYEGAQAHPESDYIASASNAHAIS